MIFSQFALVAVILLAMASLVLLISQNWRWSIAAIAVQYLGVFWLVGLHWSLGLAAVKLVAGWMAGAVLTASQATTELADETFSDLSGRIFRSLAAAMVLVLAFSLQPSIAAFIPARPPVLQGGLVLIGMGLLQLGMTTRPLRVVLGLLTVLSGFEVLYAVVESSLLVAGLLAMTTLGLALAGAYLLTAPGEEEEAP